jgi:carboxylesterase
VIPGAEAWSFAPAAPSSAGVLCLHGFTGNPSAMRRIAEAFAGADFHVELPRLPGHGTVVADMLDTTWADWLGEAAAALGRLADRCQHITVVGQSMGGGLALRLAADHPHVSALVCVNPTTQAQGDDVIAMLREFVDDGLDVIPGGRGDIADPDVVDTSYPGTPVRPLLSLQVDGLVPLPDVYPSLTMPLLLLTSPQDHVVDPAQSDYLAANYGGPVERISLERSYHVATQDFDRDLVVKAALDFAQRVLTA